MDPATALEILRGEDRYSTSRFRKFAAEVADQAHMQVGALRRVPAAPSAQPTEPSTVSTPLVAAVWWEFVMKDRFLSQVRGCHSSIRQLWTAVVTFPPRGDETIASVESRIQDIANTFATAATYSGPTLVIPAPTHPPLHGKLQDGHNARVLTSQLDAMRQTGDTLSENLAVRRANPSSIRTWIHDVSSILELIIAAERGHPGTTRQFESLFEGFDAATGPLVSNGYAIARAYTTLGISYLSEVLDHMENYAETSGQGNIGPSITITGGQFYGGQFAAQINNMNTAISNVAHGGSEQIAEALKSTADAVLADRSIDNEQRRDLLDNLTDLASAAEEAPAQRNRGRIRAALGALTAAATTAVGVEKALDTWGDVLQMILS